MLGLLFILAGVVYLAISIGVVVLAVRMAKRRGISGWKWGVPAGLAMYLLVFWDHIPTVVAHRYYCDKEAGFTVYKSLQQWKKENPGVAETLTYKKLSPTVRKHNKTVRHINERFDSVFYRESKFLSVVRIENTIRDSLNDEILAEYVDFSSGWGNITIGGASWRALKSWLSENTCEKHRENRTAFSVFFRKATNIGEVNQ